MVDRDDSWLTVSRRKSRKLAEAQYLNQRCVICGRAITTMKGVVWAGGANTLAHGECWKRRR